MFGQGDSLTSKIPWFESDDLDVVANLEVPQNYAQIKIYHGDEHIQGFAFYANNTEVILKIGKTDDRLDSSVC